MTKISCINQLLCDSNSEATICTDLAVTTHSNDLNAISYNLWPVAGLHTYYKIA